MTAYQRIEQIEECNMKVQMLRIKEKIKRYSGKIKRFLRKKYKCIKFAVLNVINS